jgi:hypothetical protein
MDETSMLSPIVIPKARVSNGFQMTELCVQGDMCKFEIPMIESYNNYICMGDAIDDLDIKCRMVKPKFDDQEPTAGLDVEFRCNRNAFKIDGENNSCYYIGDNKIQKIEREPAGA